MGLEPRSLVHPGIWTGAAIHVDGVAGADANSGLGAADGDFSAAKKTIHAAFTAGNATGGALPGDREAGQFSNSAFTSSGAVEPNQPCAIIGWGGRVDYRAGAWTQSWGLVSGTTYVATITSVMRVFCSDLLTPEGLYTELALAPDLATCIASAGTWFKDGADGIHVNIGRAPGPTDIAVIRGFHGARFLTLPMTSTLKTSTARAGSAGRCTATRSPPEHRRGELLLPLFLALDLGTSPARCRPDQAHRRACGILRL